MIVIKFLFLSLLILFIYFYLKNTQHFENTQPTNSSDNENENNISNIIYLIKKQGTDIANMEKISAELNLIINKLLNKP